MKKYGLVGKTLNHSYSKIIHEYLIEKYNIDASYELIEVDNLSNFDINSYDGLNFTHPFKEEVLKYVLNRSDNVNKTKVANVVYDQKLYNSDISGFLELVEKLNINIDDVKRIVILGNSKTSRTIKEVFNTHEVIICSRTQTNNGITYDQEDMIYGDLIINTTILGQGKYEGFSAIDSSMLSKFKYAIDVNYNPMRTRFLLDSAINELENVNGTRMLIVQAIRAFELWNDIIVNKDIYDELYHHIVQKEANGTVFIGMPYSGKTFLKEEFIKNNLDAKDTDEEIKKIYNKTPQEIISQNGEKYFREIETKVFNDLVNSNHKYIFTGGGIANNLHNIELLSRHDVILIDTPLDTLVNRFERVNDNRALIKTKEDLITLFNNRRKNYEIFANRKLTYEEIINLKWT